MDNQTICSDDIENSNAIEANIFGYTPEHADFRFKSTGYCDGNHSHGGCTTLFVAIPYSSSVQILSGDKMATQQMGDLFDLAGAA